MDAIAILQQLDQECNTWANQHAHSCNLLASLINITRQREQTLVQLQQQQQQEQQHSVSNTQPASSLVPITPSSTSKPALVAVKSLLQLIHKQTLEIESVVQQLYDTVAV